MIKTFRKVFFHKLQTQITKHPPRTRDRQGILHSSVTGTSRSTRATPIAAFQNKEPFPDEILTPVPLFVTEVARASELTHHVPCSLCNRRKHLQLWHFLNSTVCLAGNGLARPHQPKYYKDPSKHQAQRRRKFSKAYGWTTR